MHVLVTGGAGYVGSAVSAELISAGHEVAVLDDLSTGHADAIPAEAEFINTTLLDRANTCTVVADGNYDAVVHLAARSLVGESERQPQLYWKDNVIGTLNLLEAMRAASLRRLVFSSTAAVYGVPSTLPIDEEAATVPTSAYGATKLSIDLMIASYCRAFGVAAASLRYFNVAGAVDGRGERHPVETHLIPLALDVAAGRRPVLPIFGTDYSTADGTAVRDYIHVADIATAHTLALDGLVCGRHLVYNLGNGAGYSVRQVIDAVRAVTGHAIPTEAQPRRPGDPPALVASSARISTELGWRPERPLLQEMVADAWSTQHDQALSS